MRRDVLIVFGARVLPSGEPSPLLRRRLAGALAAAAACHDPWFLVMGGGGEALAMRQVLGGHGVAWERILVERESRDTLEQARRAAAILAGLPGHGRVLACTSPFHQPRCLLLLRLAGVRAERPPMPPDRLGHGPRLRCVAREFVAAVWDAGLLCLLRLTGRGPLPTSAQRGPDDRSGPSPSGSVHAGSDQA